MEKTNLGDRLPTKNYSNANNNLKVWKTPVLIQLDIKQTLLGSGECTIDPKTGECLPT